MKIVVKPPDMFKGEYNKEVEINFTHFQSVGEIEFNFTHLQSVGEVEHFFSEVGIEIGYDDLRREHKNTVAIYFKNRYDDGIQMLTHINYESGFI